MPVSRSFNKKKKVKKRQRITVTSRSSGSQQSQQLSASAPSALPMTVVVNDKEVIVDEELIVAMGGILREDEVSLPTGNVLMSEVLIEFVEPFVTLADESYRRAFLSMAVTAWNGSLLPAEKRNEVKFPDVEGASWLSELLAAMVARKHEAFAENNWMVQEYEIVGAGAEARIKVTTTVLMPHLFTN